MRAIAVATTGRRAGVTAVTAIALLWATPAALTGQSPAARDSAVHALNRLAWGPRPGQVGDVAAVGVMAWIERQLVPERIPDHVLRARERLFAILRIDSGDLARRFVAARREQLARRRAGDGAAVTPPQSEPAISELRRLGTEAQQLTVTRAVLSERQLYEVLVDFWTNHFNVFFAKGADRYLLPSYIEETIRPNALGRFEDLLIATARSPAMLFYLDNTQSVAPGSRPPLPPRAARRMTAEQREMIAERMPRGLNENYARELLELHTLGVDGGYTQHDIVDVARLLTGWGIERPEQGAAFAYRDWAHDRGEKVVLGERFPPGHGMDEGIRLLRMLASHHATMHHVSRKLCARLVADEPPDGCVDAAVAAWRGSGGDIGAVVRAIVRTPDFWAPAARRVKVKSPLEFVVSALRATGAEPDSTPRLALVIARLGQPIHMQPAPTGWPETQANWVNAGALLARMNAAVGLAAGRLPGVTLDLDAVLPRTTDHARLVDLIDERIVAGTLSDRTRAVILEQLRDVTDPVSARALAVGLAIGGPEFQRQ